jgi:hypothetical protein
MFGIQEAFVTVDGNRKDFGLSVAEFVRAEVTAF